MANKKANAADLALSKIKIRLMLDPSTVFYATILFSLKTVFDDPQVRTAAVDGVHLFINPEYFLALRDEHRLSLVIHEVLHVALCHMARKGTRDHGIFNRAGDYVINETIARNKGQIHPTWLLDKKHYDKSTEKIYIDIYKDPPPPNWHGDVIFSTDPQQTKDIQGHVANIVMRANMAHQQAGGDPGSLPGEIQVILDKYINPKLPWHVILQNHMSEMAPDDYTMRRPNRRYLPEFYLPTLYGEAVCNLAMAFDLSGSMDDTICSAYLYEANKMHTTMKPDKLTIFCFDTKVKAIQEFTREDNIIKDIKLVGRGGTQIQPVMDWAIKNKPEVLLVFTDGEFSMPDRYPSCPIIWIVHGGASFNPLKGRVIHYRIEE